MWSAAVWTRGWSRWPAAPGVLGPGAAPAAPGAGDLKGLGVREAMAGTLDGVRRAVELGFLTRGDFGLGVYNSQTLKELKKLGLSQPPPPLN